MFLAIYTGWGWVIDSEFLWQTLGNGNISLIHSPHEWPMIISKSISEERREKLSRYRNKKTKRNFGRKIKVTILIICTWITDVLLSHKRIVQIHIVISPSACSLQKLFSIFSSSMLAERLLLTTNQESAEGLQRRKNLMARGNDFGLYIV